LDEAQKQIDAVDLKMNAARFTDAAAEEKTAGEELIESEAFKAVKSTDFGDLRSKSGRIRFPLEHGLSRKSNITTTSGITAAVTGITVPARIPGVVVTAQQELRLRDMLRVFPLTTGNAFDFVRQITRTNLASPQVETSPKAESTYAWDSVSATVKTIAHYVNVSRQALDDVPWLRSMLDSELMYGLKLKEESEILSGDGLGSHISGIIPQATAYATGTYNVSGDTKLDKLRHAKLQARLAGLGTFAPDAFVLHPTDMHTIELLKTEEGGANKGLYIIGDPKAGPTIKLLWGLPVVESDSMTAGTFLVGAFGTAAYLVDRMQAMIELSYEHSSNFTANIVTALAEERVGLAVTRPGAFIYGSSY
jgi:HK97 family phage major capsid protein